MNHLPASKASLPVATSRRFWQSILCISTLLLLCSLSLSARPAPPSAVTVRLDDKAPADSATFSSPLEAFDMINRLAANGVKHIRLLVAPGVYWLDDPDDPAIRKMDDNSIPYAVTITCDTLSITATDPDPANTIFAVNRGQTRGALGNYTMIHFIGNELNVSNLTFGNYCNVDLQYPLDPSLNRPRRADAIVQAQIGICEGTDRLFAKNCRFLSRLNLCPLVGSRRSLYDNCYFECTDDALTGSAVYIGCRFNFFSSKPFYNTPLTGAVFLNCDIELRGKSPQYLTKVPGMVSLIDTHFFSSEDDTEVSWTRSEAPVVSYYSGVTLNGHPLAVDSSRPAMSVDLTATHALEAYKIVSGTDTIYNTPNLLAGDDGWDPLSMRATVEKTAKQLGRPLLDLPVALILSPSSIHLAAAGDTAAIAPRLLRWGGYEMTSEEISRLDPLTINYQSPSLLQLSSLPGWGNLRLTDGNYLPTPLSGFLTASTNFGLHGAASFTLAPSLKEAPTFRSRPTISINKGEALVDYSLTDATGDATLFEWFTASAPSLSDTIPLRYGRGRDFSRHKLTGADEGRYIAVRVTPKAPDSESGEPMMLISDSPVSRRKIPASMRKPQTDYYTDFSDIPVHQQPNRSPGAWSFDSFKPSDTSEYQWEADSLRSWYYGHGTDAATGIGLVEWTRGARAFYTPRRADCRNMSASLELQPCKSAGQGFGSATGQYLDIYLKYDPSTLSGYGLRIERTVDYDHAVVFTLMRFEDGDAKPLSTPTPSTCFRTPCRVDMAITDGTLSAHASTDAIIDTPSGNSAPLPEVTLSAQIPDAPGAATFGLQHTGTTGAGATLIENVTLHWE